MAASSPRLRVRALECRYRGAPGPALAGVDLDLEAGQITLLAGSGAAGKTTLLRCLNGLIPRSYRAEVSGRIELLGRDSANLSLAEIGSSVGTLLQDPARGIVGFDVGRELAFGPENRGLPAGQVERAVASAAARCGIEHLLQREVAELSGGELQKVALAGLLSTEPAVLLLDEPLAALDARSATNAAALFRQLADEGRSLLISEHRLEELEDAQPDQVLYLEAGEVRFRGTFAEFLRRGDSSRVAIPGRSAQRAVVSRGKAAGERVQAGPKQDSAGSAGRGPTPLLSFKQVGFDYATPSNPKPVLDQVDLDLRAGERLALLGPNGSGKSTLLRMAMGLLEPTCGRIELKGRSIAGRGAASLAREVGLVFQDPASMLFANSVLDEVLFGPTNLGLAPQAAHERAQQAMQWLGVSEAASSSPGALSIGQRKRVCLAAVAAQGAQLWLLDEPTAGLDPGGVADFLDALETTGGASSHSNGANGIEQGSPTVILATHDVDLVLSCAHRVAILIEGRLVGIGPTHEVLTDRDLLARAGLRVTRRLGELLRELDHVADSNDAHPPRGDSAR